MIINITQYDPLTGEIIQVCTAQEETLGLYGNYVLGSYPRADYYIRHGKPVKKDIKPSVHHSFDYLSCAWVADPDKIRATRMQLLRESDWTQLPDVPLVTKELWVAYRQELRDITAQPGFPRDIIWPVPPA